MALILIVLLLTLLAGMAVLALAFWPIGPGSKGRKLDDTALADAGHRGGER